MHIKYHPLIQLVTGISEILISFISLALKGYSIVVNNIKLGQQIFMAAIMTLLSIVMAVYQYFSASFLRIFHGD